MLADRLEEWALNYKAQGMRQGMQQGIQQGVQQGMRQGIQQGMQQGEALALQKLLAKRFGALPNTLQSRIHDAGREQIESWFDLAISATCLDEVFGPFIIHPL